MQPVSSLGSPHWSPAPIWARVELLLHNLNMWRSATDKRVNPLVPLMRITWSTAWSAQKTLSRPKFLQFTLEKLDKNLSKTIGFLCPKMDCQALSSQLCRADNSVVLYVWIRGTFSLISGKQSGGPRLWILMLAVHCCTRCNVGAYGNCNW